MTPDWHPLDRELNRWADAGLTLPLWWRDDDAIAPGPALDRLAGMAATIGLPVHLAVIPAHATAALAGRVASDPWLVPVVHGWAHDNHAPTGEKKVEFGAHRPQPAMVADAQQGLGHLRDLFGDRLRPMFVPPWNRIAPQLVQSLPALGYRALSTFKPRETTHAAPGLAQINTHLDPIAWKTHRGLADPAALIAQLAAQLADRREGRADNGEPYGLLTHHLVHDDAIWQFCGAVLTRLLAGPGRPWTLPATPKPEGT
jgi:hypothetical protein